MTQHMHHYVREQNEGIPPIFFFFLTECDMHVQLSVTAHNSAVLSLKATLFRTLEVRAAAIDAIKKVSACFVANSTERRQVCVATATNSLVSLPHLLWWHSG